MNDNNEISLGSVQKTLLLPLWGRAFETQKEKPLLVDHKAVEIINSLPYDFSVIARSINRISILSWIARSIYFDEKIRTFISHYPEATIINVGCGLDTTFDRVDNSTIQWIDLDLPDVIDLRKKYISESERRIFISCSVFDKTWYDRIRNKKNIMLLIAGVIYYFDEPDIKKLFNNFHNSFPGAEIVFDYASSVGIKVSNKKVIEKGGMDKSSFLKWGCDNIMELEKWHGNIRVLHNMTMFKIHKNNYPWYKRIGMSFADSLNIMSLAHIRVG